MRGISLLEACRLDKHFFLRASQMQFTWTEAVDAAIKHIVTFIHEKNGGGVALNHTVSIYTTYLLLTRLCIGSDQSW